MRAILQLDYPLKDVPLAGWSSCQRLSHLLSEFSISTPLSTVQALPVVQEEILWIEGLFPLLDRQSLAAFLAFGRKEGGCAFLCNGGQWGILFLSCLKAGSFACLAPSLARFQNDSLAFSPLTHPADLGALNRAAHAREAERVAADGAMLLCPEQTFIDVSVKIAAGVQIAANVTLAGNTDIAAGARIDCGSCLRDATIGERSHIKAYCVIESARVGVDAVIGPFAHLRPGSLLADNVRVGNFVETKNLRLGKGSKASHLSYLGDADIGSDCNIGAGTITCNYDGYNKNLTRLGDRVFIGSDCQLIAPVQVGDDGYVAAGSSVTDDVPADALAIARGRQVNKEHYANVIRASALRRKESSPKES